MMVRISEWLTLNTFDVNSLSLCKLLMCGCHNIRVIFVRVDMKSRGPADCEPGNVFSSFVQAMPC
jgi:hypothetical protein